MKDGQAMMVPSAAGAQVIVLAESRPQPVTLEQSTQAIEQLITAERKREVVTNKFKQLRESAKIEYVGKFHAPSAASGAASGAAAPAVAPVATPGVPTPPPASSGPAGLDASSITKGLGNK
jgi:hypothetical protein